MKKSDYCKAFEESILAKEAELELEGRLLKVHFKQTYESLKPINLIKNTFKQAISSPEIKDNITNTVLGMATGFISKKLVVGNTHNPLTNILGKVIEAVVTNKVINNAGEIKAITGILLKKLIEKTKS